METSKAVGFNHMTRKWQQVHSGFLTQEVRQGRGRNVESAGGKLSLRRGLPTGPQERLVELSTYIFWSGYE